MSRFRPMAATQAGEGGDCGEETGQRACERQLLRHRERWGQREMGQRRADKMTQTSEREEVDRFQRMTLVPCPHKHAYIQT